MDADPEDDSPAGSEDRLRDDNTDEHGPQPTGRTGKTRRQGSGTRRQDGERRPAIRRVDAGEETTAEDTESPADELAPPQPLKPQQIDPENAVFVLLGVVLVAGLLLAALFGF